MGSYQIKMIMNDLNRYQKKRGSEFVIESQLNKRRSKKMDSDSPFTSSVES